MSRMRLKTKLVLAISSMVLALVAIFCYLYVSHLVRQRTAEALRLELGVRRWLFTSERKPAHAVKTR